MFNTWLIVAVLGVAAGLWLWSVASVRIFPELTHYRRLRHRHHLFQKSRQRVETARWQILITVVLQFVSTALTRPLGSPYGPAISMLTAIVLGQVLTDLIFRRRIGLELRRELIHRGATLCLTCGYDLRGNVSGRCPECGVETE